MDISKLRKKLDGIDDEIVDLLLRRLKTVSEIAEYKKTSGVPIEDPAREQNILSRLTKGLDERTARFVEAVYKATFSASKAYQSQLIESNDKK